MIPTSDHAPPNDDPVLLDLLLREAQDELYGIVHERLSWLDMPEEHVAVLSDRLAQAAIAYACEIGSVGGRAAAAGGDPLLLRELSDAREDADRERIMREKAEQRHVKAVELVDDLRTKLGSAVAAAEEANRNGDLLRLESTDLKIRLAQAMGGERVVPAVSVGGQAVPEIRISHRKLGELVPGAEPADFPVRVFTDASGRTLTHADCLFIPELDSRRIVDVDGLRRLLVAWEKRHNSYVWGPTGSGKSTLVEYACALTGRPMIRVNMDSGIDRLHFVGKDAIRSDGTRTWTEFQDGVLLQAMSMPCVLLVDEIDFALPDVLYVLQRVLEGKGLLLMEEGNRFVPAHPEFRLVATANTNGQGDAQAVYRGVKELSLATLDRFSTTIRVTYLSKEQEKALLKAAFPGIPDDMAGKIAAFADEVRKSFLNGSILATLSPRQTIAIADLALTYRDLKSALVQVMFDRLGPDDRAVVEGLCQRTVGPST